MAAKPGKSTDILDAVALIVVDMQSSILDVVEGGPATVERCGFAIEAARTLGLRVVFTEQVPSKLGGTDPRLLGLVPNPRVFPKNTFSALQADGLLEFLRRQGIYHLLLAGIEIPVCIYQTALHAVDSDLDVTVLSDAVAGRRLDDCLVTLEALTRAHCHLLPSESVFYSMLGNSGHPLFPAFNALVKRYAEPGGLEAAPPPPPAREPRQHPPHERRPVLAAPEDQPDQPTDDEPGSEEHDLTADSEPYIGRAADGAPAMEPRHLGARHRDDESRGTDGEGGENEGADSDEDRESDSEGEGDGDGEDDDTQDRDAPEDARGAGPHGTGGSEEPGRKRRGRRRRGGARRRRARERRDGAPASGGTDAPAGDAHGTPEPQPDRAADVRSSDEPRDPA